MGSLRTTEDVSAQISSEGWATRQQRADTVARALALDLGALESP